MVGSFRAGLVAAALALTASCDSNPAQPGSSSGSEQLTLRLSTAHFRVLGEFIVATWGLDGLVRLVQTNGNVPATLGLSVADFEAQWYAFLKARYGVPSADSIRSGDESEQ